MPKKHQVYVDCFYYGFWIDNCDLHKYNISEKYLRNKTNKIYHENTVKECYNEIKIEQEEKQKHNKKIKLKHKQKVEELLQQSEQDKKNMINLTNIVNKISEEICKLSTLDPSYENCFYSFENLFSYNCLNYRKASINLN